MVRTTQLLAMSLSLLACLNSQLFAGAKVRVGTKVARNKQVSIDQVVHQTWDQLLKKYVDADGMVDYEALKASSEDRRELTRYLQHLSTTNTKLEASREARLAFWINAYNALTVHGILREYPTTSIRNHTARIVGYNIWKDLLLVTGDAEFSLEQIEHEILRKMSEPRIHFAIVCASIGCPRLLDEAYTPQNLEEQLERNSADFFSRARNFRYDQRRGRFELSSILNWFATDFGKDRQAQLKTISRWLPTEAARQAARNNRVRVTYIKYNWDLNRQ